MAFCAWAGPRLSSLTRGRTRSPASATPFLSPRGVGSKTHAFLREKVRAGATMGMVMSKVQGPPLSAFTVTVRAALWEVAFAAMSSTSPLLFFAAPTAHAPQVTCPATMVTSGSFVVSVTVTFSAFSGPTFSSRTRGCTRSPAFACPSLVAAVGS